MMKKYLLLLLTAIFYFGAAISAQNADPEFKLDKKLPRDTREFFGDESENGKKTLYRFAYRKMNMLNPTFGSNVKDKTIKYGWGADLGIGYIAYPFMVDGGFVFSSFIVDDDVLNYYSIYPDKSTFHYGLYASASFFPMPDFGVVTQILQPYIGIGYQTSSLHVYEHTSSSDSKKSESRASYNLGGANWKVGMLINIGSIGFVGEYRQSLVTNSPKSFSDWILGIAVKI